MKRFRRNVLLLVLPFLVMVLTNEIMRPKVDGHPYSVSGISAINSIELNKDKCSWICHNQTSKVCKNQHVKILAPYFSHTDPIFFGIMGGLQATGNYRYANIIILVVLIPLWIWYFLVRAWNIQDAIYRLEKKV